MKKGTTMDTTGKAKKTAKPAKDIKSGDKRQLPLDFSRHALRPNVKKQTPDETDATNNANTFNHQADDPSTIRSSQDPPVIQVNFVRSSTSTASVIEIKGQSVDDVDNETEQEELDFGYSGDDDDLVLSLRKIPEDDEDDDVTLSTTVTEESNTDDRLVEVKPELIEGQKDEMLFPIQYRWKTVYVAAFELALDTVLPNESFLFTDEEHTLFETYRALSGNRHCKSHLDLIYFVYEWTWHSNNFPPFACRRSKASLCETVFEKSKVLDPQVQAG